MIRLLLLFAAFARAGEIRYDLMVQGALDGELQPLLAALENKQERRLASWTYWTGRIGQQRIVVSRTEVGPINAAAATALGIERFRPKAVINQGTAGAHDPDLRLWDVVVGEKAIDYSAFRAEHGDLGAGTDPGRWNPAFHSLRLDNRALTPFRAFPGDPALIAAALKVNYSRGRVRKGNIGSAFQYNRELDHIQWLRQTYGTDTEDMESAFAAGVATGMKTRFVAIRIVSDSEWNHPAFETIAGQYCAEFVLALIRSLVR